jgi:hypothetical protein
MAGSSAAVGSLKHHLPLLVPLGGCRPLARKLKGKLWFVDGTSINVHQAGNGGIGGS